MNSKIILLLAAFVFANSWFFKSFDMTNRNLMKKSNIRVNKIALNTSEIKSGINTELTEISNYTALNASKINSGINAELIEIKNAEISNSNSNITNIAANDSKIRNRFRY
jgi:hypothetical protein